MHLEGPAQSGWVEVKCMTSSFLHTVPHRSLELWNGEQRPTVIRVTSSLYCFLLPESHELTAENVTT